MLLNLHAARNDAHFLVTTTSRFDRELKKLAASHLGLPEKFRRCLGAQGRPL